MARKQSAGRSAQAEFDRRRSAWRRRQGRLLVRTLPVALGAAGLTAWWTGWHTTSAPALGYAAGAAVVLGWLVALAQAPQSTTAWRSGAEGERATERLLRPLARRGWHVLHDRALPFTRANVDHLVVGRRGLFAVDSKNWQARGARVQFDGRTGTLWYGRQETNKTVTTAQWEATRAASAIGARLGSPVTVSAIVCVHGAPVGRTGILTVGGVTILEARRLRRHLNRHRRAWTKSEAAAVVDAAEAALPPK
ncbi:nuclease-related domain-containing protein [Kitasatospora sp. NPDC001660]